MADSENILIQSNFDSLNISRIKETDFDNSVFKDENSEYNYVKGLVEHTEVMGKSDLWDESSESGTKIKDLFKLSPYSNSKVNKNSVSIGALCERLSYVPSVNTGSIDIYPLCGDNIFRITDEYYLGYSTTNIHLKESSVSSKKQIFSSYNIDYDKTSNYSNDCTSFYEGSSSVKSITNLIKFNNGESSWKDCVTNASSVEVSSSGTTFFAPDLIRIKGYTKNESGKTITFKKDVSGLQDGTYCFSFYARVYDTRLIEYDPSKTSKDEREDIDYRNSESNCKSKIKVYFKDGSSEKSPKFSIHRDIPFDGDEYELNGRWKRLSFILDVNAISLDGDLSFCIDWSYDNSNQRYPIEICGLLLEKQSYPSPYDKRLISYKSGITSTSNKIYPLTVFTGYKDSLGSLVDTIEGTSWTINYKRLIDASSQSEYKFIDTLGNIKFGYDGNRYVVIKDGAEIKSSDPSFSADDYYQKLEDVFIMFTRTSTKKTKSKSNAKIGTLKITVKTMDNEYSINDIEVNSGDLELKYIDTNCGAYNLLLGYGDNSGSGYYRDLVYYPYILSDTDISKVHNSYFSVTTTDDCMYERRFIFNPYYPSKSSGKQKINPINRNGLINLNSAIGVDKYWEVSPESINSYVLSEDIDLSGVKYSKGDILICTSSFTSKLPEEKVRLYWSRTAYVEETENKTDQSVLVSPLIIEGFEKIYEKKIKRNNIWHI